MEVRNELKEKWFKTPQAAKEAGVTNQTILNNIYAGKLVAKKMFDGSREYYLISESNLLEWVNDRKSIKTKVVRQQNVSELTVDDVAQWIKDQISKAYNDGYKDGSQNAKKEILTAVKGVR